MITNQSPTEVKAMKSGQAVRISRFQLATVHNAAREVQSRCRRATGPEAYGLLADACGSAANALTAAIEAALLTPEADGLLNDGTLARLNEVAFNQGAAAYEALRVVDKILAALAPYASRPNPLAEEYEHLLAVAKSACPAYQEPNRLRALQRQLVSTQKYLQEWVIEV